MNGQLLNGHHEHDPTHAGEANVRNHAMFDRDDVSVRDHIADLRHTADSVRIERAGQPVARGGGTPRQVRRAVGRWLISVGTAIGGVRDDARDVVASHRTASRLGASDPCIDSSTPA